MARATRTFFKKQFATGTSPIIHLVCPPKFCITFDFHFSWVLKPSQEKLKTMLMQNFGGQIRCILGDVHVANRLRLATQQLCTYTTLFCKFLCRFYTTTTWKCLIKISRLLEDGNKWHRFSFSLLALWCIPLGFIKFLPETFPKTLTNWMTWNNGDEVCNTVNSPFCCRFNIDDCFLGKTFSVIHLTSYRHEYNIPKA